MSTENNVPRRDDGRPESASASYVSKAGGYATLPYISGAVSDLREGLEELERVVRSPSGLAKEFGYLFDILNNLDPDMDACPVSYAEQKKLNDARRTLAVAYEDAQDVLRSEAERQKKEAIIRESFAIPAATLFAVLSAVFDARTAEHPGEVFAAAKEALENEGWIVYGEHGPANPAYVRSRAPLRQLLALIENFPCHHLTSHVLSVMRHALRWCENTSRGHGLVHNGALYPHIAMELQTLNSAKDVPREWREPLVNDNAQDGECHE
ncbi:MAG: hypothetical protein RBR41_03270 [Desulfovibrio sp.]|uniref:hypothetical protein n=1 Tax=Desulfovibrio sp. TaxID=885 RepID=UPI002A35B4AB|nr:hypothetical protein [Desulfovibrio sp.]MDY0258672.1 hypothetical protein [Desulfovibrio sp.]